MSFYLAKKKKTFQKKKVGVFLQILKAMMNTRIDCMVWTLFQEPEKEEDFDNRETFSMKQGFIFRILTGPSRFFN